MVPSAAVSMDPRQLSLPSFSGFRLSLSGSRRAGQARLGLPKVQAWLAGLGVYALWTVLVPGTVFQVITPGWAACWLLARLIGSILLIPVVEELAFRGYLLR